MKCLKSSLVFLFLFQVVAFAWQVKGRSTLPSDCKEGETWVTDHSKSIGNWTAFCRVLPGGSGSKAYKHWKSRFQPGRPYDWPFLEETTDWQAKDVKDVLWATEKIPECLWHSGIKGIYRMKRAQDPSNPGIQRKDSIVLYNPAFQNEEYLKRVLLHELAHKHFSDFSKIERRRYAESAGWSVTRENGKETFSAPSCCFVTPDAGLSIDENFANNAEYYFLFPKTLKQTDSKSYGWLEKHFGPKCKIGGSTK